MECAALFAMTPREIHLLLTARQAAITRENQRLLLLARYVALAVHDPARLPDLPAPPLSDMTDEEMKQRLLAWRRKESP